MDLMNLIASLYQTARETDNSAADSEVPSFERGIAAGIRIATDQLVAALAEGGN